MDQHLRASSVQQLVRLIERARERRVFTFSVFTIHIRHCVGQFLLSLSPPSFSPASPSALTFLVPRYLFLLVLTTHLSALFPGGDDTFGSCRIPLFIFSHRMAIERIPLQLATLMPTRAIIPTAYLRSPPLALGRRTRADTQQLSAWKCVNCLSADSSMLVAQGLGVNGLRQQIAGRQSSLSLVSRGARRK